MSADLIEVMFRDINATLADYEFFQVGDTQFFARTVADLDILLISEDGTLLGMSDPFLVPSAEVGQAFDASKNIRFSRPITSSLNGGN